jgi:transaldolase
VKETLEILKGHPKIELIWASPRELLNIFEAEESGCHIITATPEILKKLTYLNYDLEEFSLDTVKMFLRDAQNSGFTIP